MCKSLFWGSKRRHLVEESLPVEKSERNSTHDFDERRPLSVSQRPSRRQKAVRPQGERWKGNRREREREREQKREEPSEAKWFEHQSAPSPSESVPLVGLSKFGCALAVDRRAVGQLYSSHGYEHLFTLAAEAHSLCSPSVCIVCALFRCLKKQATKRNIWMTRSDLCKSEAVWRFVVTSGCWCHARWPLRRPTCSTDRCSSTTTAQTGGGEASMEETEKEPE